MALQDDLKTALIEAGERIKEDLWTEQDPVVLEQRAKDLAGLAQKALTSNDEAKRKQYALAAELVVQHVALLALLRLNYAEKRVLEEIEQFFKDALAAIIPMLFAAI